MTGEELSEMLRERFRRADTMAEIFALARDTAVSGSPQTFVERVQIAFAYAPGGWYMQDHTVSFGSGVSPDSSLDVFLLREIVARRDRWDTPPHLRPPTWYDGLVCRTGLSLLKTGRFHELEPKETAAVLAAHAVARRNREIRSLNAAA